MSEDQDAPTAGELVTTVQQRSVLNDMAQRYGMEPTPFEQTVRAICMPKDHTREQFAAFLLVAKEYRLNPLTKEIYAFPAKGGGIIPVVSIDGWVSLVNSHPMCDGFTFSWVQDEKGDPISCTCTMFRKDRSHPTEVTEYFAECVRSTDPWKMKHRMLRHKTMIQAARYAFGFSGIYDEDEGAKIAEATPRDITPPTPPEPPMPPTATEASGGTAPTKTASEAAADFNNDESGVEAIPDFLARIEKELSFAMTPDAVEEAFDLLDVQATLTGDEEKLVEAFNIKAAHVKRTQRAAAVAAGQTDMLDGMPEATKAAVKNARTP